MYGNKRIRGSDSRSDSSSRNIPYETTNILLDHGGDSSSDSSSRNIPYETTNILLDHGWTQEDQVMAALIISISSDPSEESVVDPLVAPDVGTVLVVSPTRVLDLVDYSSYSDSYPLEDSLPPVPDLPLVSPFLCSDDSKADSESEPSEQRPVSSSHDTLAPLSEFPLAPDVAPPEIRRCTGTRIRPDEAIPFGRPYRTHLNGPHHHSSPYSSSSSSPSDHSLSGHTPPDTTDADSSTPRDLFIDQLLGLHDIVRLLDVGAPTPADLLPPRKRLKDSYSSEDSGEEHMKVDTTDVETVVDVGISEGVVAHPEDGVGIGFEIAASDVREDDEEFDAEASAANAREIAVDPLAIGDSSESSRRGIPDLEDTIYDIVQYMSEVHH
ncbi:hypothetical protein Tco_1417835 [Tanacetum coccineum]